LSLRGRLSLNIRGVLRSSGLCVCWTVAIDALASTPASATTATATPARGTGSIFSIRGCGIAFGDGLFVSFFGVFFFRQELRLGDDQTVGAGQGRSSHFHIGKFAVFIFVLEFQKIGDIQKRVALKSYVNERGLHAGQHASDAPFVNGASQRVFVLTLELYFGKLIVFDQRHLGFMRRG